MRVSRPGGLLAAALIMLAVLLAWETLSRMGKVSPIFFPAPSRVAVALAAEWRAGDLPKNTAITFMRLASGFVVGAGAGMLLGLVMGWSRRLRSVADPIVASLHPIPKIAILPLFLIIFGLGESPRVAIIAVAAFFPMLISTMAGVRQISPIHFEVAQNYGAGPLAAFRHVVLPGSLPMILAGARLSLNTSLTVAIAVELSTSRNGLGAMAWNAWETLRIEKLYAALVAIAAMGIAFNLTLAALTRVFVRWQIEREV